MQKIVFIGSGPVAAKSLSLLSDNFDVEAVITKSSTKSLMSKATSAPVYEVNSKHELNRLVQAKPFSSKLAILIDFGIIISREVIDYFPLGIINSHFSILPQWRGPDPITFAILSSQKTTGVSLMLIDEGMDTGKIITSKSITITDKEDTRSLTNKLIELSDALLRKYVTKYVVGKVKALEQPHPDRATYSRKLTKLDGVIDWAKPNYEIEREIRAFIEWPRSRTVFAGKDVIITSVELAKEEGLPGDISASNTALQVFCGVGSVLIKHIQPAGKKEMPVEAFLAGYKHQL